MKSPYRGSFMLERGNGGNGFIRVTVIAMISCVKYHHCSYFLYSALVFLTISIK